MAHRADAAALLDNRGYSGPLLRGKNPATLIETGVRDRITESYYWKEQCFGLNEATLCDRAAELTYIGGTYSDFGRPTPFLCLLFKMLQLQPSKAVVKEYLDWTEEEDEKSVNGDDAEMGNGDSKPANGDSHNGRLGSRNDFKYLRALAAFYIRLAWDPVEIYSTLEPRLEDYRKLKRRLKDGFILTYMDQFIDDLLSKDRVCGTALWKLPTRTMLEDDGKLEPRESKVADQLHSDSDVDMRDDDDARSPSRTSSPPTPRARSPSTSPERVVKRKRSPSPRSLPAPKRISPGLQAPSQTTAPSGPQPTANDEATKSARQVGPTKSSSNVRMTTYIDFAPDVCKDYKQTGFCGYGDNCKYLHAREDYKAGWALDKEWEVERNRKKGGVEKEKEEKEGEKKEEIPFACFICKKGYSNPVVTKCGHYFCEKCALERFKKSPACAACGAATGGVFKTAKNLMKRKEKEKAEV
ncbi:PRP38-domain-containing protein [Eremomyces bilateralis CBS 781.70]|uniref:Multifunctional fusion protein n=1 Tax=Eremomyces bilateralis CBS 781.70 TaxID=1392243 RepID=A0A6G1FRX9_9PEZI|nr:PRP38-domain-containing protein [Eremomyces bilateralis CBS 781.70]KAF1808527.1 PRP38-domain-containing protein [Eremomyces bilateralis CBS 781.70]